MGTQAAAGAAAGRACVRARACVCVCVFGGRWSNAIVWDPVEKWGREMEQKGAKQNKKKKAARLMPVNPVTLEKLLSVLVKQWKNEETL